jgi:predicted transcriptional regulator YdeE
MDYKIVEVESFCLEGLKAKFKMDKDLAYNIANLWGIYMKDYAPKIKGDNICVNVFNDKDRDLEAHVGFKSNEDCVFTVPTGKYAKFSFIGLILENNENRLQKFMNDCYDKLDNDGVKYNSNFNYEQYDERFSHDSVASVFDIYIPLEEV